uniref:UL25 n=1 Tax=Tadarida gammaherpesvirus TaxID=2781867 RepID=A0A7U3NPP4_9GAMA|nr:UL25 [Tadarida gammaherpesvirus]
MILAIMIQGDVYVITVAPGDPGFTVEKDFKLELITGLYSQPSQWLPSYGPWYTNMTGMAMQRRIFPKELKGNANFQNSTSLKLMTATLTTISSVTNDVFQDVRHLSDVNAGICLINGYYCLKTGTSLPTSYKEMLNDLDEKIELIVSDLKNDKSSDEFTFNYSNNKQLETIAPLNKDMRYSVDFFSKHKIYNMFFQAGMFSTTKSQQVPGKSDSSDIIFSITSAIFGENIPPFATYQWNLRVGLKTIETLILIYLILETSQISQNVNRRLQLHALLGNKFQRPTPQPPSMFFKRGQTFAFLMENYLVPSLINNPQASTSFLFPGMVLIAIESNDIGNNDTGRRFVNLTGRKFNEIFEIINQRFMIYDPVALLQAQTAIRLVVENGLNTLLTKASPATSCSEIIRTQFGGVDDYDKLYFLVLGCLPVTVAVV